MTHRAAPASEALFIIGDRLHALVKTGGIAVGMASAAVIGVASWALLEPWVAKTLIAFLSSGIGLLVVLYVVRQIGLARRSSAIEGMETLLKGDPKPSFITTARADLCYRNAAASAPEFHPTTRGGQAERGGQADSLPDSLRHLFADASAVVSRLAENALVDGRARQDILSLQGHTHLSVVKCAGGLLLWQLVGPSDRALISDISPPNIPIPALSTDKAGAITYSNAALNEMVGRQVHLEGDVFANTQEKQPLATVHTAKGSVKCLTIEVENDHGGADFFLWPGALPAAPSGEQGWEISDALPVPLCKLSRDGVVVLTNSALRSLFSGVELEGQSLSELVTGLGRSVTEWVAEAARGRAATSEFLTLSDPQETQFVQITLNPVIEGGEVFVIALIQDVSKLKSLEAQFVQSQKMQAIGQLAGGIAHDFNNLLTAISGHCDLLLLRRDQGDQDYSDLMQIHQNANRAASLVRQLLAFSRKQTLQPEVIDMRETLSDLAHLLNRLLGATVTLKLSQPPELPPIRADKRQLEQVLINLVVNARDAMPKGGEVVIDTAAVTLEEPLKRDRAVVKEGEYVVFKIQDSGCGIAPDVLKQIFEPFFTTKPSSKGTGLGLSTAYGIIKQSGGYIFADSVLNVGTTFWVYLPALTNETPLSQAVPTADRAAPSWKDKVSVHGDGVIMLVEDEAPVRAFASRALRLRGYTVVEADSAEAALEQLEDDALKIDIFISDVIMPGLDGPTWVREALKSRPHTKVIFISGYAEDTFVERKNTINNAIFLPKPFSLVELTKTVKSVMTA